MNIDYNLYKIFLYLYEEKSISKTANKLYVSQPAISYSLKELENQLGYTLFYRNSKGIEPTTEAKELYNYISTAFNILNDAEEHIKNLNELNTGCIRIGLPDYLGTFFLSDIIKSFHDKFPGISFQIISTSSSKMQEMLEMRKLDLVFDILPVDCKKTIKKTVLTKFQNGFAYYKGFTKNKNNSFNELSNYPMILPGKNSSIRLKLDEWLESNNSSFQTIMDCWNTNNIIDLIRNKVGIGYFIKDMVSSQYDKDNFEWISIEEELPSIDLCLLYIEDFETAATKKFINTIKDKYTK